MTTTAASICMQAGKGQCPGLRINTVMPPTGCEQVFHCRTQCSGKSAYLDDFPKTVGQAICCPLPRPDVVLNDVPLHDALEQA